MARNKKKSQAIMSIQKYFVKFGAVAGAWILVWYLIDYSSKAKVKKMAAGH